MITFKKFTLVGLASVFLSGSIQAADTPTLKYGGRLQADYCYRDRAVAKKRWARLTTQVVAPCDIMQWQMELETVRAHIHQFDSYLTNGTPPIGLHTFDGDLSLSDSRSVSSCNTKTPTDTSSS